jgi:hypothetical protein
MGWASANSIFDPVAQAMIELNASDEMKIRVLAALIGPLRDGDWDTADVSLDAFRDDPAVVEAFRQNDLTLICGDENDALGQWCDLELGHPGDHACTCLLTGHPLTWPVWDTSG